MTPSTALARVARGDLCSGCGGCAAVAPDRIRMEMDAAGWLRPRQTADLDPGQEDAIAAICPGLRLDLDAGDRRDDPLWGPYVACRSGHAVDPALRYQASSGGGLSALVTHLLETGQVDRVLQIAADPDNPVGNVTVLSVTPVEVFAAAGSRYAPSAPLARLEEVLVAEGVSAFIGKPCDVAALRALARRDARIDAKIPVMLSFFCAGVPAQRGAEAVVTKLGVAPGDLAAFRYRGEGWPGFATATRRDGTTARMSYNDSWGTILNRHLQFRCKICADGIGSFADVVCADAWECDENGYPIFEEGDGVSLILSRTVKGEDLVQAAMATGRISAQPMEIGTLAAMQPSQASRKATLLSRLAALKVFGRPVPAYAGLNLRSAARKTTLRANLRGFLGMARRVVRPRPD